MTTTVALIVVEGALEVPASLRLLRDVGISTEGLLPANKGGRGPFWKDAPRYNQAAASIGFVLGLTDLESFPCPSGLIQRHLGASLHPNFVLRIAERMLESWFLADTGLARFIGVSSTLLPRNPDAERHPKLTLVNLARRSKSRSIRNDLVPEKGSLGIVGRGYTPRMSEFIAEHWRPSDAQQRSESLRRALAALRKIAKS
jgi:hypothetical protein